MSATYKIAVAQIDIRFAEPAANLARMLQTLEETGVAGARLTVFPECSLTGYCFDSLEEAMPVAQTAPGPATDELARACERIGTFCIFGMLERCGDRLFNSCVLVGPGGVLGVYRKIHLPYLGIDRFTTPGDRPFAVQAAGEARVGMHICYDGAFPEAARVMALDGADIIVLPTNWPPGAECMADFVVQSRALENAVFFVACNRVGEERGFRFIGQSKICGTNGAVLAAANHDREEILWADLDLEQARRKHIVRVPLKHEINRFADRRPEMYARLLDAVTERRPELP
ncbi:MAG: carbon-nitrogen hydrolase family protein [Planctomycetales bacterium]|nr:carbon-nitrogen hydrolase family protein [Planctomycetales bacterium]